MKGYTLPISVLLFLLIQGILVWGLDLRDLPGAAGTETLYKAAIGERKSDYTVWVLQLIQYNLGVHIRTSAHICSLLGGVAAVLGSFFAGCAISSRSGSYTALLCSVWPMTHYYTLMTGADPLAFGSAWLSVGLCWYGASRGILGLPLLMLGLCMASFAVRVKELALPPVALILLTPLWIRSYAQGIVLAPFALYSAYWGYAWMWPSQSHRLQTEIVLHLDSVLNGWNRLVLLYERGIPQGKFDQFIVLSALLLPFSKLKWRKYLLWCIGALVLIGAAYMLQQKARPRYLAGSAMGVLIALGALGATIRLHRIFFISLLGLLAVDSWAFFEVWGTKRQEMVGGHAPKFPRSPNTWRRQYEAMSDITLRDLSLYGAIALVEKVQKTDGLASMRLRDERHRSLIAFATLYDKSALVLDPGACCAGSPVDENCSKRIVEALDSAGFTLVLPTQIKGVERIYPNEERWKTLLLQSVNQGVHSIEEEAYWLYKTPSQNGGSLPCQAQVPFRSAK